MKKLKLNFTGNGEMLSRDQLKQVIGGMGSGGSGGGNIWCVIGGAQSRCYGSNVIDCVDACVMEAESIGLICGGCAEFPPL
ncbi:hypothetical protein [Albibacterium indicum]|uniref:hypothetical protein n=1 Tax=Albibacterium indicum TaxID=2292082 RepID=UPI0013001E88|nr:hypothetical protein [Pedobacter indicus]